MNHRLLTISILCLVLISSGLPQEHPDSVDYKKVQSDAMMEALNLLEIEPFELGFDKLWATDSTRLKRVEDMMNNPLAIPEYVTDWGEILDFIDHDFATGIFEISKDLDAPVDASEVASLRTPTFIHPPSDPLWCHRAIHEIWAGFGRATPWLNKAMYSLSESDREAVLMIAPSLWEDEDDSTDNGLKGALHRSYGIEIDTSRKVDADTLLHISAKFDRHALLMGAIAVLNGIRNAMPYLDTLTTIEAKKESESISGKCILNIARTFGNTVIGGPEDNVYNGEYAVIIDVGGNDTYNGRSAGAVGGLEPPYGRPYSVIIDLEGDDTYRSDSVLVSLGAGVFGVGVLIDMEGHDVYQGWHLSQGAGFFGVGILADYDGWDSYRSGYFAQGSGQVGVGWLHDGGGNDIYTLDAWGQGFGSMFGFGILNDMSGSDTYRAGGRYFHHPLRPEDSRSFAQGFGMGFRPRGGGGIGFLYDKEGNDFYNAEIYAQGTSYWYSLGMLLDRSGQDIYNAAQYSQGAGIHLAVGALIDQDGEDHYYSKFGPAQGEGHDLAVGVLVDNKGNDTYMVSGGQGIGLSNSIGIFIDGEGNDTYSTTESAFGQGSVRAARGFAGAGIFLDLEGFDHYPRERPGGDSLNWIQRDWGIGIDLPRDVITPEEKVPEVDIQPEDTLRPVEDIFHDAALWEVTENRLKVRTAREALKLKGMEAIEYVFENEMDTDSGLKLRAIKELFDEYPDFTASRLIPMLKNSDPEIRGNSIYFLGILKRTEAIPQLIEMLENEEYKRHWTGIIWAIGQIGDSTAVDPIIPFMKSENERRRIYTTVALGKLKNPSTIDYLIEALDDSMLTVRSAAVTSLANMQDHAFNPIFNSIINNGATSLKVNILGKIFAKIEEKKEKNPQKIAKKIRNVIAPFLDANNPRLRLETAITLSKLHNKKSMKLIRKRHKFEDHPLVKPAIQRILEESNSR